VLYGQLVPWLIRHQVAPEAQYITFDLDFVSGTRAHVPLYSTEIGVLRTTLVINIPCVVSTVGIFRLRHISTATVWCLPNYNGLVIMGLLRARDYGQVLYAKRVVCAKLYYN
jgi:hypothetical protein